MISMVLLLIGAVSITACGARVATVARGVQPSQLDPVLANGTRVQAIEATRNAAKTGRLQCPYADECNPTVAMISVVTELGLERCSGVLVSENAVMTNDHCVNKSISLQGWETRSKGLPCKNSVFIHLAGTSKLESLNFDCSEIEVRSGETGINSKDFAIIKLDGRVTDRKVSKVSQRGFVDGETASIYRVQMESGVSGAFDGSQNRLDCQASYATFLYPLLSTMDSPLMTFGDCAIQAGNSGSPIFNRNGEIGAVVQGYLTVKQDPAILQGLGEVMLDPSYGLVAIGTQTQCVPEINPSRSQVCTEILPMTGYHPKDYLSMFKRFDLGVLPKPISGWEWHEFLTGDALKKVFFSKPICTSQKSFDSHAMVYQEGMNRLMKGEWRLSPEVSETIKNFSQIQGNPVGALSFLNSDLGTITIPTCGR